jgi:hypothetical protein
MIWHVSCGSWLRGAPSSSALDAIECPGPALPCENGEDTGTLGAEGEKGMLWRRYQSCTVAAKAVAEQVTDEDLSIGLICPSQSQIFSLTCTRAYRAVYSE